MSLRRYRIVLTAIGPVHIGNGQAYKKKDYFKIDDKRVGVLDVKHFVSLLSPEELDDYCRFLETDSRSGFQDFIEQNRQLKEKAYKCVLYEVETTLAKARRGSYQYIDVAQCIKDQQHRPYIPGSSLKGMLRTALLTSLILRDQQSYSALYDSSLAQNKSKTACKAIERRVFWKETPDTKDPDIVNDIMRYVSVSDSEPLSVTDLVFAKKYDKFALTDPGSHKHAIGKISREPAYREGNELNIYREAIRPGTRVEFTVNVDERIDAYLDGITLNADGIISVLEDAFGLYKRCFLDSFESETTSGNRNASTPDDGRCQFVYTNGILKGKRCRNRAVGNTGYCNTHKDQTMPVSKQVACYLGGGVDFDSKTVVNALFSQRADRVYEISRILYAQFPTKLDSRIHDDLESDVREAGFEPIRMQARRNGSRLIKGKDDHRHWKDAELGVSPHTMKLAIIGGKKYPMGKCSLQIEELQ
jgi:CRISPR/Cas system CSM-associated protein Csm5 (group 7 of RAMP superfamily)